MNLEKVTWKRRSLCERIQLLLAVVLAVVNLALGILERFEIMDTVRWIDGLLRGTMMLLLSLALRRSQRGSSAILTCFAFVYYLFGIIWFVIWLGF